MSGRKFKVYKAALGRVTNPLPVPTICPHCQGKVELVSNSTIYRREYGQWPFAYKCVSAECDSYVGIHPKTDIPLGTLANKPMRDARKAAKAAFSPMWEKHGMEKSSAYAWLAEKWALPVDMSDPAIRAYVTAAAPQRAHELIQIINRFQSENADMKLRLRAEEQRNDEHLETTQRLREALAQEQARYGALALQLAEEKAKRIHVPDTADQMIAYGKACAAASAPNAALVARQGDKV